MDSNRRDFLKLAGLTAVAGVAIPSAFGSLLKGEAMASGGPEPVAKTTGKRYGMVIDVKKFAENPGLAEKCINACHTNHNVPDFGNKKDEIKWIWVDSYEHVFPADSQYKRPDNLYKLPILTLCNHCDNPPCVRACPTKATFRKKDGIVGMDYHRCIGCRFCMAACPYGARSFNWRDPRGKDANGRPFIKAENPQYPTRMRGVVEKCNFCTERLAIGKIPACVEAAAEAKGLIFGDMNDPNAEISQVLKTTYTIQRNPALGTHPSLFYII